MVQENLRELQPQLRNEDTIQLAIEKAFIDLDNSIINNYVNSAQNNGIALEEKIRYMQLAMSGSCALLSLYDLMTNTLYTACTGDSRATLGYEERLRKDFHPGLRCKKPYTGMGKSLVRIINSYVATDAGTLASSNTADFHTLQSATKPASFLALSESFLAKSSAPSRE